MVHTNAGKRAWTDTKNLLRHGSSLATVAALALATASMITPSAAAHQKNSDMDPISIKYKPTIDFNRKDHINLKYAKHKIGHKLLYKNYITDVPQPNAINGFVTTPPNNVCLKSEVVYSYQCTYQFDINIVAGINARVSDNTYVFVEFMQIKTGLPFIVKNGQDDVYNLLVGAQIKF